MGCSIELKGLAVIIVGGMGSLPGALVGGIALGLAEVFAVQLRRLVLAGRGRLRAALRDPAAAAAGPVRRAPGPGGLSRRARDYVCDHHARSP